MTHGWNSGSGAADDSWRRFAAMLATDPDLVAALLRTHYPTETRHGVMCHACTRPGYGTFNTPFPCSIHAIATAAAQMSRVSP